MASPQGGGAEEDSRMADENTGLRTRAANSACRDGRFGRGCRRAGLCLYFMGQWMKLGFMPCELLTSVNRSYIRWLLGFLPTHAALASGLFLCVVHAVGRVPAISDVLDKMDGGPQVRQITIFLMLKEALHRPQTVIRRLTPVKIEIRSPEFIGLTVPDQRAFCPLFS